MSKDLVLLPLLNEKTYSQSKALNTFVFKISSTLNKHSVKRAVEEQFGVNVSSVNITNYQGKLKRIISINAKRSINKSGRRAGFKKAYVKLAEGSTLSFFESIEEEQNKQQKTQEKINKALEKEASKKAIKPKTAEPIRHFLRQRKGVDT